MVDPRVYHAVDLPVCLIVPDPDQPRKEFDAEPLQELALSIKANGVIQPLVVRPLPGALCRVRLIAGERRWRAAQRAGLEVVPCVIRDVTDEQAEDIALAENDLRESLKLLEQGRAYRRLMERRSLDLPGAAAQLKKSISWVEFRVRLLNLRAEYQEALGKGWLSVAQAGALARLPHVHQPRVFALYRRGTNSCEVDRIITALLETDTQTVIEVPDVEATAEAGRRLERTLTKIGAEIGRCYSKKDLELLGWASSGVTDVSLTRVGLIIKQLTAMQDALRQAKARDAVRAPAPLELTA